MKVPVHARGPFNASGAASLLTIGGAFNDSFLAQTGRFTVVNIKLNIGKAGGVSSLQVMYGKAWAPARGTARSGDLLQTFATDLDGVKEFIAEAFYKPNAGIETFGKPIPGITIDDLLFKTNTGRSIGGTFAKPAELLPMHPCPSWKPGGFRLAWIAGNTATPLAKTSPYLISLSLYWVNASLSLPVGFCLGCGA